jgi:magnesium-transporting ATPase (P-type)
MSPLKEIFKNEIANIKKTMPGKSKPRDVIKTTNRLIKKFVSFSFFFFILLLFSVVLSFSPDELSFVFFLSFVSLMPARLLQWIAGSLALPLGPLLNYSRDGKLQRI